MTDLLPFSAEFKQSVHFTSAKSWLHPDAARSYGHIGMKIIFSLVGPKGAISWVLSPGWYIKPTRDAWAGRYHVDESMRFKPDSHDLGYHAYEPQYEGQTSRHCNLLDGGRCYSDGTSLGALELIEPFLAGGDEWLWKHLRALYEHRFNDAPWPEPITEYEPHPDDKESAK